MYLRDITFIYDGNTDHIDENKTLINFEKFELVAALLSEIEKYQGTPYDMYAHISFPLTASQPYMNVCVCV